MNDHEKIRLEIMKQFKRMRLNKELMAIEVATDLGFSYSYFSKIEQGQTNSMPLRMYFKLADYYNVSLSDLMRNAEQKIKRENYLKHKFKQGKLILVRKNFEQYYFERE